MKDWRTLVRVDRLAKLIANHRQQEPLKGTRGEIDFQPVVRLVNPTGAGTWLLSECDEQGLAFGLCVIHEPELGSVLMAELAGFRGLAGLGIEEDLHWEPDRTISSYAEAARAGQGV